MTILPIFRPSARIRERSPFDVGCASRMDLAAARRVFAALLAGTGVNVEFAFEDFVLPFVGAGSAVSAESSSSVSITPALVDESDFSAAGIARLWVTGVAVLVAAPVLAILPLLTSITSRGGFDSNDAL